MAKAELPSPGLLRKLLDYNPETGALMWRPCAKGIGCAGKPAGCKDKLGYVKVVYNRREYLAHRIAWAITHNAWPETMIDHVNRDRSDNRLCNLRLCRKSENACNSKAYANNTSGFRGVTFAKRQGKYVAQISVQGRRIHLGLFGTAEEAARAYDNAARAWHGAFATVNGVL